MRKIVILLTLLATLMFASIVRANESYEIAIDANGPAIIKSNIIVTRAGTMINVILYASAGTGYEWQTNLDQNKLVKLIDKHVSPVYNNKAITGGKMKHEFVMQVQNVITDREDVKFSLVRPWEKDTKPAREFTLSVMLGNVIEKN